MEEASAADAETDDVTDDVITMMNDDVSGMIIAQQSSLINSVGDVATPGGLGPNYYIIQSENAEEPTIVHFSGDIDAETANYACNGDTVDADSMSIEMDAEGNLVFVKKPVEAKNSGLSPGETEETYTLEMNENGEYVIKNAEGSTTNTAVVSGDGDDNRHYILVENHDDVGGGEPQAESRTETMSLVASGDGNYMLVQGAGQNDGGVSLIRGEDDNYILVENLNSDDATSEMVTFLDAENNASMGHLQNVTAVESHAKSPRRSNVAAIESHTPAILSRSKSRDFEAKNNAAMESEIAAAVESEIAEEQALKVTKIVINKDNSVTKSFVKPVRVKEEIPNSVGLPVFLVNNDMSKYSGHSNDSSLQTPGTVYIVNENGNLVRADNQITDLKFAKSKQKPDRQSAAAALQPAPCLCGKSFSRSYNLMRHLITGHIRGSVCDICDTKLTVAGRREHMRNHLVYGWEQPSVADGTVGTCRRPTSDYDVNRTQVPNTVNDFNEETTPRIASYVPETVTDLDTVHNVERLDEPEPQTEQQTESMEDISQTPDDNCTVSLVDADNDMQHLNTSEQVVAETNSKNFNPLETIKLIQSNIYSIEEIEPPPSVSQLEQQETNIVLTLEAGQGDGQGAGQGEHEVLQAEVEPSNVFTSGNGMLVFNEKGELVTVEQEDPVHVHVVSAPIDSNTTKLECPGCPGKIFNQTFNLKRHMMICHMHNNVCTICNESVSTEQRRNHMTQHMYFRCEMCAPPAADSLFKTKRELDDHLRAEHCDDTIFQCGECSRNFPNVETLTVHINKHLSVDPLTNKTIVKSELVDSDVDDGELNDDDEYTEVEEGELQTLLNNLGVSVVGKEGIQSNNLISETDPAACDICWKVFKTSKQCERHKSKNRCGPSKPFSCEICSKSFKGRAYWRVHMRLHTGETPFDCNKCDMSFISAAKLREHKLSHKPGDVAPSPRKRAHVCDTCHMAFYDRRNLERHIMTHQEHLKPHQCSLCEKRFRDRRDLRNHVKTHLGKRENKDNGAIEPANPRPYLCSICGKNFRDVASLNKHRSVHSEDRPYQCTICMKTFKSYAATHAHIRVHSGDRPFVCEICNRSFGRLSNLCEHRKLVHNVENTNKPGKRIAATLPATMLLHKLVDESESDDETLKAPPRGKKRKGKSDPSEKPARKTRIVQLDTKSAAEALDKDEFDVTKVKVEALSCTVCGRAFNDRSSLSRHMATHSDDKPFSCEVCGRKFRLKSYIRSHMATHTGNKPHKCDMCEATFNDTGTLYKHRRVHTGERPYQCSVCEKRFKTFTETKIHQRIHTGEKPHQCTLCFKFFRRQSNLWEHCKLVHNRDTSVGISRKVPNTASLTDDSMEIYVDIENHKDVTSLAREAVSKIMASISQSELKQ